MSGTSELLTVGVDIGGTNLRAAVVDSGGRILAVEQMPTPTNTEDLEIALTRAVSRLQKSHNDGSAYIGAVGLAVAGFIDENRTRVRFAPHLPWRNTEITARIGRRLGLPVLLEHDANAAAVGEYHYGAAAGAGHWVLFALGTGIGGAIMEGGEVRRGAFGTSGEFGHIVVMPDGRRCPCGKCGCLERYCSGSALPLYAQDLIATGCFADSDLTQSYTERPEELTGRMIVRAARTGDELALAVCREMGMWLGRGLTMVQDILDPELVVLGGGVSTSADLFLDTACEELAGSIVGAGHRPVARVVPASLGGDAGMIGVAFLARDIARR